MTLAVSLCRGTHLSHCHTRLCHSLTLSASVTICHTNSASVPVCYIFPKLPQYLSFNLPLFTLLPVLHAYCEFCFGLSVSASGSLPVLFGSMCLYHSNSLPDTLCLWCSVCLFACLPLVFCDRLITVHPPRTTFTSYFHFNCFFFFWSAC